MRITKEEAVVIAAALFCYADDETDIDKQRGILSLACAIDDYSEDGRTGQYWSPNITDLPQTERMKRIFKRRGEALKTRKRRGQYSYLFIDKTTTS